MDQLVEFSANHPLLIAALIAAFVAVPVVGLRQRQHGVTHVSAADAVRLINKGAVVVDVRKAEAYAQGHIVNARNVELERIAKGEDAVGKKKDKIFLAVCDDGSTSGKAALLLRKAGYENTFSLKGGLIGWRTDNLPLVKT